MDANQDQGAKELFQGQAQLYKLMFNHLSSMSLKCAIELGIADIIHSHGRAITLSELMRLLVHSGCFKKTKVNGEEEAYGLTAASTLLIKDKPYCLSPTVSVFVDPFFVAPFQSLSSWFKGTEITLWETVHGIKFWEFMNQNPAINQRFNEAMASDSEIMTTFVVKSECKQIFEGLGSLVDVGGGNGTFSRIISEAFPGIKCTVLDLPHAVANLPEADNLKYIAGDMFRFIPPADAFLFKLVFHGLGDEDGLKILKKRREAIASNGERGKVIIIDIVINAEEEEHELTETKFLFDIMMSVNATGKERTESEWAKLFFDAGFSHYKIHY
ncbi:O-methyltransferase ZRP4 [Citrus sinensis]|uniref:O-methyltransferase ZRP4 n=1 Tax=Citrus sinensis TaxID=2711 RepID=A0ACB8I0H8_CITSI|nr:O-methyltransferase ZRP4 [Citrus sinensis]